MTTPLTTVATDLAREHATRALADWHHAATLFLEAQRQWLEAKLQHGDDSPEAHTAGKAHGSACRRADRMRRRLSRLMGAARKQ